MSYLHMLLVKPKSPFPANICRRSQRQQGFRAADLCCFGPGCQGRRMRWPEGAAEGSDAGATPSRTHTQGARHAGAPPRHGIFFHCRRMHAGPIQQSQARKCLMQDLRLPIPLGVASQSTSALFGVSPNLKQSKHLGRGEAEVASGKLQLKHGKACLREDMSEVSERLAQLQLLRKGGVGDYIGCHAGGGSIWEAAAERWRSAPARGRGRGGRQAGRRAVQPDASNNLHCVGATQHYGDAQTGCGYLATCSAHPGLKALIRLPWWWQRCGRRYSPLRYVAAGANFTSAPENAADLRDSAGRHAGDGAFQRAITAEGRHCNV
jgi:hypothetical protein